MAEIRTEALSRQSTDSLPMLVTGDDAEKQLRLDRMRRNATGLLGLAAVVFVVARLLEPRWPWMSFVRATAEAAMVGGIADWFAVTALFRYPLGIPIPHTAIVPNRKDRIGGSLGRFVERNFLSPEILTTRIRSLRVAEKLADWLQRPESAARLARHATDAIGAMVRSLDDREVEALIERQLAGRIRDIEATPVAADVLSLFLAGDRKHELLDGTLGLLDRLLEDNKDQLRERIEREIPWWIPAPIDEKIYQKIFTATELALHEVRSDHDHPFRHRFDELVDASVDRLKSSPEIIAKGEALKEELLSGAAIATFAQRLWSDLQETLLPDTGDRSDLTLPIERAIMRFGQSLRGDEALLARVNDWVEKGVVHAAEEYRHEVAQLIETTVAKWDPEETSRKIELQVGRDLQFIRINGTLVGGLVGLLIHTIAVLF